MNSRGAARRRKVIYLAVLLWMIVLIIELAQAYVDHSSWFILQIALFACVLLFLLYSPISTRRFRIQVRETTDRLSYPILFGVMSRGDLVALVLEKDGVRALSENGSYFQLPWAKIEAEGVRSGLLPAIQLRSMDGRSLVVVPRVVFGLFADTRRGRDNWLKRIQSAKSAA